jgi:hypothetical protein
MRPFEGGETLEPSLETVRDALNQGGAVDPFALLQAQLAGQSATDPRAAMLLQFLQQRRSAAASARPAAEAVPRDDMDDDGPSRARSERVAGAREVRATLRDLYAEVEALRRRNDEIAAAVGACFVCYGDDPACAECGGLGKPGSCAPEPAAYRKYVVPAVRRAQRGVSRKYGEPAPGSNGAASQPAAPAPQCGGV